MAYPINSRVEEKENNKSQPTLRDWNSQFLTCSELFFPIMPYGQIFSNNTDWPSLNELNYYKPQGLITRSGLEIFFILQKGARHKVGLDNLYEPRIYLKGEVKTRSKNWHDFFNSQIWYHFPKSKAALNMRHFIAFDEIAQFPWSASPISRSREQDFLTMFDEGGCALMCSAERSMPFIFGHATYEQIVYGNLDLSMCTLKIQCDDSFFNLNSIEQIAYVDHSLALLLANRSLYKKSNAFFSLSITKAKEFLLNLSQFQLL
ncbi:DUF3025 domain-containing protein [Spirobacillus cienkowskii]|jgi:hypothetical protein|uniref:DUF3025 domain-containing protein n=1 Tax=Spirobacillus cienkowskii TaxID=495820 RepID=A0A369KR09_9BACT|nr:MAG: DUF3025 domain-containing protein [Spirobacillus cienkowskii]